MAGTERNVCGMDKGVVKKPQVLDVSICIITFVLHLKLFGTWCLYCFAFQ